jgi:hypothetical protein
MKMTSPNGQEASPALPRSYTELLDILAEIIADDVIRNTDTIAQGD